MPVPVKLLRLILLVLALIMPAMPALAGSSGKVVLARSSDGKCLFADIDEAGHFNVPVTLPQNCFLQGVSQLVATDGMVFGYSLNSGSSEVLSVDPWDFWFLNPKLTLSPFWKLIVSQGPYLFFYDRANTAAIAYLTPAGTLVQTDTRANFSVWTNIVATANHLLFYNSSTGTIAVGAIIGRSGQFGQSSAGNIGSNYSLAVSRGDGVVFYNLTTGGYRTGMIVYNGGIHDNFVTVGTGTLPKNYARAVWNNGHLLMYGFSGAAAIYALDAAGHLVLTQSLAEGTWSDIIQAGSNLFFYYKSSGSYKVAHISNAGKLVNSAFGGLGFLANSIVATRQ